MKNSGFQRLNVKKQECKISHQSFVLIEKNMKRIYIHNIYKVVSNSLQPHGLHSPWNSPGQNTGVGRLSLLQGIVPTQGSNPALPHCRWILYQLSHKGSPYIFMSHFAIWQKLTQHCKLTIHFNKFFNTLINFLKIVYVDYNVG